MNRPRPLPRLPLRILVCVLGGLAGGLPVVAEGPSAPFSLDDVGGPSLLLRTPAGLEPLPVLDLSVRLDITGILVHGSVAQSFRNPTDAVIEALYVFPLPESSAVHHMEMRIGERKIVSVIREREEAQRTYEAAKQEGRKAALVEQQRPNLFTSAVANVNPGEIVEVRLEYLQEIEYADDGLAVTFPLTFLPRFHAAGAPAGAGAPVPSTTALLPRPSAPASAPAAKVIATLRPGFPLDGGDVHSPSHDVTSHWEGDALIIETRLPVVPADRDFRLTWRPLPGHEPRSAAFVEERDDARYLLLMVLPPEDDGPGTGLATETLFVVDVSGSMEGQSIARAREALDAALARLRPDDTFNILTFADDLVPFSDRFLPAREEEIRDARGWVAGLRTRGGTRIDRALRQALAMTDGSAGERSRRIVFLTDGGVDNEEEVLDILRRGLGSTRLHALGIGAAPNRYLLREMGRLGRGLCGFVADAGAVVNEIDGFLERLDRPVWTDLELDWDGPDRIELFPDPLPDLHAGEPLFASIRVASGEPIRRLSLRGRSREGAAGIDVDLSADVPEASGVAVRWARARVRALDDLRRQGMDEQAVRAEEIDTSLRFGIVTRYTSLVAVEEFPTASGEAQQVRVPAGVPAGMLPRGGTGAPFFARLGAVLTITGAALWLLGTVPGRRPAAVPAAAAGTAADEPPR